MKTELDATKIKKEEIESYFQSLQSNQMLENIWNKLEEDSKINLETGMYLFDTQKAFSQNSKTDFSASIINWCLAVENELKQKIYIPFEKYCKRNKIYLPNVNWQNITFGTYIGIIGYKGTKADKKAFYSFCETIYTYFCEEKSFHCGINC